LTSEKKCFIVTFIGGKSNMKQQKHIRHWKITYVLNEQQYTGDFIGDISDWLENYGSIRLITKLTAVGHRVGRSLL